MSLFKSKKSDEASMKEGKPSLSVAFSAQRFGKKKKMAEGGRVEEASDGETADEALARSKTRYMSKDEQDSAAKEDRPLSDFYNPKKMAMGGEVEGHVDSIVDAIMRKRKFAEGGMVDLEDNSEEEPNQFDGMNADAAEEDQYDLDQLSAQPEDSNEQGDDIEADVHDLVSQIRAKLKAKQGK